MKQQQASEKNQKVQQKASQPSVRSKVSDRVSEHPSLRAQGIIGNHGVLSHYGSNVVQAKLAVSTPNDRYEREADLVAREVTHHIHSDVSSHGAIQYWRVSKYSKDKREKLRRKRIDHVNLSRLPLLGPGEGIVVIPSLEVAIERARGNECVLPNQVRKPMEEAFRADFSGVRVHSNAGSDTLNRILGARALTVGQDVFFRQGAYNPGSPQGQELIAHELVHVLQQCSSQVPKVAMPDSQRLRGWEEIAGSKKRSLSLSPLMFAASWENQGSREWLEFQRLVHVLETQGFAFEERTRDIYGPSIWRVSLPDDLVRQESMDLIPTVEQHYRFVRRDVILDQMWQWMQGARELGIQTEEEQTRPSNLSSSQTRFDQEQRNEGLVMGLFAPGRLLSVEEIRRVNFALASVLSRYDIDGREWIRNLPLWIAYYNYYSEHPLRTISPSEARTEGWGENEAAKTEGIWPWGNFTILRENALGERYPARTLGALLLHEFVHVRHPGGYAISQIHLEGEAYGVEFFFAERSHDMNRMARIIPFYQNPTTVGCESLQIQSFRSLFRNYYGTLVCLYERIDNIPSPRCDDPYIRSLLRSEAYELARDLVESPTEDQGERLRPIYEWVSDHSGNFPIRM